MHPREGRRLEHYNNIILNNEKHASHLRKIDLDDGTNVQTHLHVQIAYLCSIISRFPSSRLAAP